MKRSVSLNAVALLDWPVHAGNNNSNGGQAKTDQTRIWKCSWDCSSRSSFQKLVKNKSSRNLTNHISLEPAFNKDHESNHEFIQKSTYKKIRSKKVLMFKLQIKISLWILNDLARFELHSTLCCTLYLSHMLISRIVSFEILPSWCAAVGIELFRSKLCKTDSLLCCRRWMEMIAQLRNAWMMENLQTAIDAQGCTVAILLASSTNSFKQMHNSTC